MSVEWARVHSIPHLCQYGRSRRVFNSRDLVKVLQYNESYPFQGKPEIDRPPTY